MKIKSTHIEKKKAFHAHVADASMSGVKCQRKTPRETTDIRE